MKNRKIIVFGAGKIGRSFIGQVFSRSGHEVVLVDINRELINLINERKEYSVIILDGEKKETLLVKNVRGVCLEDEDCVVAELKDAGIASLSVGQQGLKGAVPIIAKSLIVRREIYRDFPLDIIIAENMRNADEFLQDEFKKYLPVDYPFHKLVGLVETSIGKMVPIMMQKDIYEDPLQIFAEPYNSLIVAKNGFKNPIPDSPFLAPKDNIKAWVDRKLFIHNMGHATVAYFGFKSHPNATYIYEVLEDHTIFEKVRKTMLQSADILQALYPEEFTHKDLEDHIDDLLHRFCNKGLGDTIFRVGCDLYRKLGPEDRLVAPIRNALRIGKPYNLILQALEAGIAFKAKDENGNCHTSDIKFFKEAIKGYKHIIKNVCMLPEEIIN